MSDLTNLRSLFAAYANGEISTEQLQVVEAALRKDRHLRREFIEYMNIDSALGDLAALSEAEFARLADESPYGMNDLHPPTGRVGREERASGEGFRGRDHDELNKPVGPSFTGARSSRREHAERSRRFVVRSFAIVAAAAASLLIAAVLWVAESSVAENAPGATLVTEVDAALLRNSVLWKDAELPKGVYRLDQGLVHLRFAGGVMVYVEAPAQFDIVSEQRLELLGGRLSASVPPEGIGFTVETSQATVVDHGTEFSIEAESGASEVHVFKGLVRVHSRLGRNAGQDAIDLRTSEAIRIEDSPQSPLTIQLATDRFIRTFEEPQRNYVRTVRQLSPIAYYRMPIRDRGLISIPPEYSGEVLTGDGIRPPHAHGVFAGGSLRVGADSTGRGGRVDVPPPLGTGQFSLVVFAYPKSLAPGGTLATNIRGSEGDFALSLDENGRLQATIRNDDGELRSVASDAALPLTTWRQVVVTADGGHLRLYEDGRLTASLPCSGMATSRAATTWFGTNADGSGLWNGRIDELALFDRALHEDDIADLYQAAQEEMARWE